MPLSKTGFIFSQTFVMSLLVNLLRTPGPNLLPVHRKSTTVIVLSTVRQEQTTSVGDQANPTSGWTAYAVPQVKGSTFTKPPMVMTFMSTARMVRYRANIIGIMVPIPGVISLVGHVTRRAVGLLHILVRLICDRSCHVMVLHIVTFYGASFRSGTTRASLVI